ncbi:ATP-binding protein [Pseudomonas chlororaphis]|uniref:ATP-binding protein n=1 Tax=Pseudomonas chlororaphis TaxID=587753 RepID=UPI0023666E92|nr:ATP-binding protein [Pseudomonas chlororaphis]WDH23245.1 ATP-binding protein [Pseudomonas chlororaphis]
MSAIAVLDRARTAIELGESHFREFKSALEGPPGDKKKRSVKDIATNISQTLVAFANADGGELLVGVEDNGEISGLPDFTDREYEVLETAPTNRIHSDTPLPGVRKYRLTIEGKSILYFSVPKSVQCVHITTDGRCLQRRDLESVPVAVETIQFDRREVKSREYDRSFIDGVSADDLNIELVKTVADQVLKGMSAEKCLQYLELGEYGLSQLRLRRAALLLFAKEPHKWHPRLQIRILKVDGNDVKTGEEYNVISDQVIQGNILTLIDSAWEAMRPFLIQTKIDSHARFEQRSIYPELACREALLNSIAHRDYSDEGRGIEVYIFDDHLEVRNPGALLSSMRLEDIVSQKGVHQSRNSYVARVLRELGYMRELGEGMRRIYDLMNKNELAPPALISRPDGFSITLTNRAMYSHLDLLWLSQFDHLALDREMKSVILLGQEGRIFSALQIWEAVGIVDTEDYRKLVESLFKIGVLQNEIERDTARRIAQKKKIPFRSFPRYKISIPGKVSEGSQSEDSSLSDEKSKAALESSNFQSEVLVSKGHAEVEEGRAEIKEVSGGKLFIANLPLKAIDNDLYDLFSVFGTIVELKVPRRYNKTKGYGFIEFELPSSAKAALDQHGELVYLDRKLVIRPSTAKSL